MCDLVSLASLPFWPVAIAHYKVSRRYVPVSIEDSKLALPSANPATELGGVARFTFQLPCDVDNSTGAVSSRSQPGHRTLVGAFAVN